MGKPASRRAAESRQCAVALGRLIPPAQCQFLAKSPLLFAVKIISHPPDRFKKGAQASSPASAHGVAGEIILIPNRLLERQSKAGEDPAIAPRNPKKNVA
jgi:hypothetical protein